MQVIQQAMRGPMILGVSKGNLVVKIEEITNYSYKTTNSSG